VFFLYLGTAAFSAFNIFDHVLDRMRYIECITLKYSRLMVSEFFQQLVDPICNYADPQIMNLFFEFFYLNCFYNTKRTFLCHVYPLILIPYPLVFFPRIYRHAAEHAYRTDHPYQSCHYHGHCLPPAPGQRSRGIVQRLETDVNVLRAFLSLEPVPVLPAQVRPVHQTYHRVVQQV